MSLLPNPTPTTVTTVDEIESLLSKYPADSNATQRLSEIFDQLHKCLTWGKQFVLQPGHISSSLFSTSITTPVDASSFSSPMTSPLSATHKEIAVEYESRVRGPRPSRPSAVNAAISASRSGAATPLRSGATTPTGSTVGGVMSPGDGGLSRVGFHEHAAEKVRLHCLQCLHLLARSAPKLVHTHWIPFIPKDGQDALSKQPFTPSLMTVLLYDHSAKVRALATECLALMLVDSPITRWTATGVASSGGRVKKNPETKDAKTSGGRIPLTIPFAHILRGLHIGLLQGLVNERHPTVLTQILKTISVLVVNTPYQTMQQIATSMGVKEEAGRLLIPIVDRLLTHMLQEPTAAIATSSSSSTTVATKPPTTSRLPSSRASITLSVDSTSSSSSPSLPAHVDLRPAVFSCLASIFETTSIIKELTPFLAPSTTKIEVIPLLIAHAHARQPTDPTPDAFTVLSKLAHNYPSTLSPYWLSRLGANSLSQLIKESLSKDDTQTKLLALKILEEWNKQDSGSQSDHAPDEDEETGGNYEPSPSTADGFFALEGGRDMIAVELPKTYRLSTTSNSTSSSTQLTPAEVHAQKQAGVASGNIRAKILECLSLLPHDQWISLDGRQQQVLLKLSLEAGKDEATNVRTAACRCLCLFTLYSARMTSTATAISPALAATVEFITPTVYIHSSITLLLNLINPATSTVIGVRVKAAWALANIADFGESTPPLHRLLSPELFHSLIDALLASTNDHDKVISNGVRGVGNLARWFPLDAASSSTFLCMVSTIISRIHSSKSPKSKWNACHALGNVFQNVHLPARITADAQFRDQIHAAFQVLIEVVKVQANFKVRINAATALSTPITKGHYGSAFTFVLESLLQLTSASDASTAPSTIKDVKYLAQLRQEILASLCHMLCLFDGTQINQIEEDSKLTQTQSSSSTTSPSNSTTADPAAADLELFQLYVNQSSSLAQLILGERLRWEKELKQCERMERLTNKNSIQASSAAVSPKRHPASLVPGSTTVGFSRPTILAAQTLVEKAAASIESVLRVIEKRQPQTVGLVQSFTAAANGELDAVFPTSPTKLTQA